MTSIVQGYLTSPLVLVQEIYVFVLNYVDYPVYM